jgi:hypothetical protein
MKTGTTIKVFMIDGTEFLSLNILGWVASKESFQILTEVESLILIPWGAIKMVTITDKDNIARWMNENKIN